MASVQSISNSLPREAVPAHQGLLREETLALRHIFNLDLGRPGLSNSKYPNLPQVIGQDMPGSRIKDLLIVSIDVENPKPSQLADNGSYQIGLCILDTRDLLPSVLATKKISSDLLHTFHFCVGHEKYYRKSWGFCFGQARHTALDIIRIEIQEKVLGRDVVLVIYGTEDISFLQAADIDLHPLYILDAQKAAQHPLNLRRRCSLERLLRLLDIPFEPELLHVAGNDANFTLCATLLVALIDSVALQAMGPAQQDLLIAFERIARDAVPMEKYRNEVQARLKKEMNREKRDRKNRTKQKRKALTAETNEDLDNN